MFALRSLKSAVLALALVVLVLPNVSKAAYLGMPQRLTLQGGGDYTTDATPTFTWGAATNATWYDASIDGGAFYTGIGNNFSYTSSWLPDGWHTVYVRSHNNAGDVNANALLRFEVDAIANIVLYDDLDFGPTVSSVYPSTATEDVRVTLSVEPYGYSSVEWCDLYVDGSNVGDMTRIRGNLFELSYTFGNDGSYSVYASCTDAMYRTTIGPSRKVTVYNYNGTNTDVSSGRLIKIACASGARFDDPCKAVYYYGDDNKRHAFPNESVYFSWYSNFDAVEELSATSVSRIALGRNVTYKPGSVLVQFTSSSSIYAVSKGAILRKYLNTSLVRDDWGSDWSAYLVSVPQTYFGNYTVGSVIDSSSDYDRNTARNSVRSIDDSF